MSCAVVYSYSVGLPGQAGAYLQIDAVNTPLFCELEFFIDTTSVTLGGTVHYPADGLHGGPPNVNFFSGWRVSVYVPFLASFPQAGDAFCLSFNTPNGTIDTCPALGLTLAGNAPTFDTDSGKEYNLDTALAGATPTFTTDHSGGRTNNDAAIIQTTMPINWQLQRFDVKTRKERTS